MSNDDYPVIFADGLLDVSHANGVFRISFGEQEGEGKVKMVGKIMIPGNQIGPVVQQITTAVNDIAGRMQKNKKPANPVRKAASPARKAAAPVKKTSARNVTRQAKSQAVKKKAPASSAKKAPVRRKKTTK